MLLLQYNQNLYHHQGYPHLLDHGYPHLLDHGYPHLLDHGYQPLPLDHGNQYVKIAVVWYFSFFL
jgi:hypothetical protein